MQDFNAIEKLWNSHSVEVKISSDEMLAQVKKEVNGLRSRSALNIILMLASVAALCIIWYMFDFNSVITHIGIAITILSVLIYTFILYGDYRLIAKTDFTLHPQEYLESLRLYQLNRYRLYNRLYWFYVVALSIGISLYFIEILSYFTPAGRVLAIVLTFSWMYFCSTLVRKAVIKRERERISLLIEKFERLSKQLKD
ncbi:MAG: hypothetical protein EOO89_28350 [Pedobacter sp.]|nr:MAG: hypothetical protein EOO89_28350 [Pedobacter sp.]